MAANRCSCEAWSKQGYELKWKDHDIYQIFLKFFPLFCDIDSIRQSLAKKEEVEVRHINYHFFFSRFWRIVEVQFTSRFWPPICCTRTTKGSSIVSIEPISTSNLMIIQFQLGFQDSLFEAMRKRYCAVKDYWKKIWDGEITIGRNPKTFGRHALQMEIYDETNLTCVGWAWTPGVSPAATFYFQTLQEFHLFWIGLNCVWWIG